MKQLVMALFLLLSFSYTQAQDKVGKITIKTSIYCDHCRQCESCGKRLENAVYGVKGVKRVDIDTATKEVAIVYHPKKTNVDELRKAIAAVGFDADDVKGNPAIYAQWDECCKK